jgi:DNA-binding LacI/PurR family transcriptional regulator
MTDEPARVSRVIRLPNTAREATMKDIAKVAGVSQSTVSRVLSGAPPSVRITEGTRQRVTEVARGLGFQPNPVARALRGARTMVLGVIVADITDPFFPGVVEAVSAAARSRGYNVVLAHARGRAREAVALKAVLETRHCDAIILLGDMRGQPRVLREVGESRVPSVGLAGGSGHGAGITTVDVDDRHGIAAAMEYLVGLGHERIAYVGPRPYGDFTARRTAYLELALAHHLDFHRGYDVVAENNAGSGAAAFASLMALRVPPTAVVAGTDVIAIGALNAAYRAGIAVPGDVSVTGFDDLNLSGFLVPPLTTVRMPAAEMANAAVSAAIELVGRAPGEIEPASHVFLPELVVRESCAPPAGSDRTSPTRPSPEGAVGGAPNDGAPGDGIKPILEAS